jgi:putative transposase
VKGKTWDRAHVVGRITFAQYTERHLSSDTCIGRSPRAEKGETALGPPPTNRFGFGLRHVGIARSGDPPHASGHTAAMSSYPTRRQQRLPGYDYTTAGFYFVTLCIRDRLPLLGTVVASEMRLTPAGELVQQVCAETPHRCPGVELDTLVIMPDHLHAVISLLGEASSLSAGIHRIKSRATARYALGVRASGWPAFHGGLWQQGFHDRIIRDDKELNAMREYVVQNPLRWSLKEDGV